MGSSILSFLSSGWTCHFESLIANVLTASTLGSVFGLIATIAWIMAEFVNMIQMAVEIKANNKSWHIVVSLIKSIAQIVGAIFLLAYVSRGLAVRLESMEMQETALVVVFAIGSAIAGFGALLGIVSGLRKHHKKNQARLNN